jgi:hypothetical protein
MQIFRQQARKHTVLGNLRGASFRKRTAAKAKTAAPGFSAQARKQTSRVGANGQRNSMDDAPTVRPSPAPALRSRIARYEAIRTCAPPVDFTETRRQVPAIPAASVASAARL